MAILNMAFISLGYKQLLHLRRFAKMVRHLLLLRHLRIPWLSSAKDCFIKSSFGFSLTKVVSMIDWQSELFRTMWILFLIVLDLEWIWFSHHLSKAKILASTFPSKWVAACHVYGTATCLLVLYHTKGRTLKPYVPALLQNACSKMGRTHPKASECSQITGMVGTYRTRNWYLRAVIEAGRSSNVLTDRFSRSPSRNLQCNQEGIINLSCRVRFSWELQYNTV